MGYNNNAVLTLGWNSGKIARERDLMKGVRSHKWVLALSGREISNIDRQKKSLVEGMRTTRYTGN